MSVREVFINHLLKVIVQINGTGESHLGLSVMPNFRNYKEKDKGHLGGSID